MVYWSMCYTNENQVANAISQWNVTTNQNQRKSSDQVSCPSSTGGEKWIKPTGPVTFIYINKYSNTEILAFCYWHN